MSNYSDSSRDMDTGGRFTAKDAITTGAFGAIIIGIRFLFMLLGGISPYMWFASHAIDAFLIGPVFMLIVARTRKNGPYIIISMVIALVFLASTWMLLITLAIGGIICELILGGSKFKSRVAMIIAFIVFNLGFIGDFMPLYFTKSEFMAKSMQSFSPEYLDTLNKIISGPSLAIVIASVVGSSIVGGLLGLALNRKHFEKAGVI